MIDKDHASGPNLTAKGIVKEPILLLILFIIITDISVLLDLQIYRQIFGFFFLTLFPGAIILSVLRPCRMSLKEMFVLSVGLSISSIMFVGLFINNTYQFLFINSPLSTNSLLISLSIFYLLLLIIAQKRSTNFVFLKDIKFRQHMNNHDKLVVSISLTFPLLSILGINLMNTLNNNMLIMLLFFAIPIFIILMCICKDKISEKTYAIVLFLISISIVLLLGLRSSHIIGIDSHFEYYIFQQTLINERWLILGGTTLDSCLSISILPAIYQKFLNINPEYVFKLIYPIFFSLMPIVIFVICRYYVSNIYSFLASIFFMSQNIFINSAYSSRTTLAILFFSLSIMVLISPKLSVMIKKIFLMVFISSCIISHYSTTYIFFGILLSSMFFSGFLLFYNKHFNKNFFNNVPLQCNKSELSVTVGLVLIFFSLMFLWYSQITDASFNSSVQFFTRTIDNMQNFFIKDIRDENINLALGYGFDELKFSQRIRFISSWLSILFIAIGTITALVKHYKWINIAPNDKFLSHNILNEKFDVTFISLSLSGCLIMLISVTFPYISTGYGIDRAYIQMLVLLSLFFVLGGWHISHYFRMRNKYIFILIVLLLNFICVTGLMNQVFGPPTSILLNSNGTSYDILYVHDQETSAAKWLNYFMNKNLSIYSDKYGTRRLMSQGLIDLPIYSDTIVELIKKNSSIKNGYIYLRYNGVVDGKLYGKDSEDPWHSINEFKTIFNKRNNIYTNNGSAILV